MQDEIWKNTEYDGYMASNLGRVSHNNKILKAADHGNGYTTVYIKGKNRYLHRIIANTFIPNPTHKEQVNHKNGIKSDNRLENLEWTTRLENVRHAKEVLKKDFCKVRHKVQMITKTENIIFESIADAERYLFGKRTKTIESQIRKKGYFSKKGILIY